MNTPNNDALILDIRISELKERGDKLIHRERFANQSEADAQEFKKLYAQREQLVEARWRLVPIKHQKWIHNLANKTNVVMKKWRQENKMRAKAE